MKSLHFIGGLPRSGSTLLCNLLNLNFNFIATPTSGILPTLLDIKKTFSVLPEWQAQYRDDMRDQILSSMKGFINGFYQNDKIIFDKNRGWANNLTFIDSVLNNSESKLIWCYRDLTQIFQSIELQDIKTNHLYSSDDLSLDNSTMWNRYQNSINETGIIGRPLNGLLEALEHGHKDRILGVNFDSLCMYPEKTLDDIHNFLRIDRFRYNIADLKQKTFEFDGVYNFKFSHTIREGSVNKGPNHNFVTPRYDEYAKSKWGWYYTELKDLIYTI